MGDRTLGPASLNSVLVIPQGIPFSCISSINLSWIQKTYTYGFPFQVADELVAEFSDPNINIDSPDPDNPNAVRNTTTTLGQLYIKYLNAVF